MKHGKYNTTMGSDIVRDGMYLELSKDDKFVAEIFYSDNSKEFESSSFAECEIPFNVLIDFIEEAKKRLPETKK